jgi:xanthine/CO dehydrogenase XdhC/CoxF family maturation factor
MLDDTLLNEIDRLQRAGTAFCLAGIVDGGGSIPQIVGAAALFTAEGLACGTVGGGALEESCR